MSAREAEGSPANYFDALLARLVAIGQPESCARAEVFDAYLDGKPGDRGKKAFTRRDRDELFWSSRAVGDCLVDEWRNESMILATPACAVRGRLLQILQAPSDAPGFRAIVHEPRSLVWPAPEARVGTDEKRNRRPTSARRYRA